MTRSLVPSRKDLMYPTLLALKAKGGSASIHEIAEQVASDLNLSDEILNVPSVSSTRTLYKYNLTWARTNLKKAGMITNPSRATWAITAQGRKIQSERELYKFTGQKSSKHFKASYISNKPKGSTWSSEEIDITVAAYFEMLRLEQQGEAYVKLDKNRELQQWIGRTHKAIEYKHQNISAVLQHLAMDWIPGYKPATHYQNALADSVVRYLCRPLGISVRDIPVDESNLLKHTYLVPEPVPATRPRESTIPTRVPQKFDPAARDAHNRKLGELGEEQIWMSERVHLTNIGRKDLARKVKWISKEVGDGLGYDVLSFNASGDKRLLEVKTTSGDQHTPFYLTRNELELSVERPNEFRLMRVYDFAQSPKVFKLVPPLEKAVTLQAKHYLASFYHD